MGWLDRFLKKGKQAGWNVTDNRGEEPSSDLLEYIKTKTPEMQKNMESYRLPDFDNNREKMSVKNSKSQTSADITNGGRYHNGTINLEQYQEMQNKYVKGELTFKSNPVHVQQLEVTSAQNIHGVDLFGDKDNMEKFWGQHGRTHEEYLELASHIPEVQKRLDAGEKLENICNDPEIGACARQYFSPDIMPRVQKYKDTYEMCDGGRHRIIAAQELGLDIPVRVSGEFADNNELNEGNGVDDQKQLRESFKDGQYKEIVTDREMTLYRVFDGHGALSGGRYYTTEKPVDAMQAKSDLALPAEWKNSRLYVEKITIPPGTKVAVGTVAPQRTLSQKEAARSAEENGTMAQWQEGPDLPGGAVQVVLEENYLRNHPEIEPEVESLGFSGNYKEFEKKASELEKQENMETAQVVESAKMLPPGQETQMLPPGQETQMLPPGQETQMLPPGEEAQSPLPEKEDRMDLTEEGEKNPSDENMNRESWEQGRENTVKNSYEEVGENRGPDDGEPPHGQGPSGTDLAEEEPAEAEKKSQTGSEKNVELSSEKDGQEIVTRPEDNLENVEQSEKPENTEKNQVQSETNQEEKNRETEGTEEKKEAEGENKTENQSEWTGRSGEGTESETENQVYTEVRSESVSELENGKKISGEEENEMKNVNPSADTSESRPESVNQAERMTRAEDKTEISGQEDKETENTYMEARADQPEKDIEANNEMREESGDLPEKGSGEKNGSHTNEADQTPQQEASEDYSYGYGY